MNKLRRIIKNLIIESTIKVNPELIDSIYNAYMERIYENNNIREDLSEPDRFGFKILKLPLNSIFGYTPNSKDLKIGLLTFNYWQNNKKKDKSITNDIYKNFIKKLSTENFDSIMNKIKFNLALKIINDAEKNFYGAFKSYQSIIFNIWKTEKYLAGSILINLAQYMYDKKNINNNIKNTISHEIVHFIQLVMTLLIKLGKEIINIFENNTNNEENKVYDINSFVFQNKAKKFGLSNLKSKTNLKKNTSSETQESSFNLETYLLSDTEYKVWVSDIIKNIYNFILNFGFELRRDLNLDSNYFNLVSGQNIFNNITKENYMDAANNIIKILYGDQNPDNAFQIIQDKKNKFSTNPDKSLTQLEFLRTNLKNEKRKKTLINDLSVGLQRKFKEELNLNENISINKIRHLIKAEIKRY